MKSDSLFWLFWVIVAFPIAMVVLGEILVDMRAKGQKMVTVVEATRNLIIPSGVIYIVLHKIIGRTLEGPLVRISATVMWISIIFTALTLLNLILFEDAPEGSWQSKVPKIMLDAGRLFLVLVGAAIVLSRVWGQDLGSLVTALGVGSLVIGLALQDSLGNIFSGVVLLFEQPFKLGDWIQVGETAGRVKEITWRSVHVLTKAGNVVIVPNSELSKNRVRNYDRPNNFHELDLFLTFSYDDPPNKVKAVLYDVAIGTEGVLRDPPPFIRLVEYGDFNIKYLIGLYIQDFSVELRIKDRFLTHVWYASKRAALTMPYPISTQLQQEIVLPSAEEKTQQNRKSLLEIPLLAHLDDELIELLSREAIWLDYAKDEVIVSEGEVLLGMYLIVFGSAILTVTSQTIGQVAEGEFFGEKATLLSHQVSDFSVKAIEDLRVLLIEQNTLRSIIENPRSLTLINQLGESMELRRRLIKGLNS